MARTGGRIHDEVVLAQAELTRTLALVSILKGTGRREEHPVEVVLLGEEVEIEVAQRTNTVDDRVGDDPGIHHTHTRLDKQCSGTADDEQTLSAPSSLPMTSTDMPATVSSSPPVPSQVSRVLSNA